MAEPVRASARLEFAARRLMIMAAPNGARRTRRDHDRLPITPTELAAEAVLLRETGVSVLHLHVRDGQGGHTLGVEAYRAAIGAIRDAVGDDLVIQVTTEAVGMYRAPEQMAMVRELQPEAFSMALREINPETAGDGEYGDFCAWASRAGIWPQIILYTPDDLAWFDRLRRAGVYGAEPPSCLFVLGNYAENRVGSVAELDAFLATVDCSLFPWSVCCFGPGEQQVMLAATAAGGHVRIGFENNLWLPDGALAEDNAALVRAFTAAVRSGPGRRQPATADEIRQVFF